jgi:hypothetical protein
VHNLHEPWELDELPEGQRWMSWNGQIYQRTNDGHWHKLVPEREITTLCQLPHCERDCEGLHLPGWKLGPEW